MSRTALLFLLLTALVGTLFTVDLAVGSVAIAPGDLRAALTGGPCDPTIADIVWKIRLP